VDTHNLVDTDNLRLLIKWFVNRRDPERVCNLQGLKRGIIGLLELQERIIVVTTQ
jgi:hypothetical protein